MHKPYCHLPTITCTDGKIIPGDFSLTTAQREAAFASLGLIRSKNPDTTEATKAAQRLLDAALFLTNLVQNAFVYQTAIIQEISKGYAYFPLLVASKDGADTERRLRLIIGGLPIGANGPFKLPKSKAKNDKIRTLILDHYDGIQRFRLGDAVLPSWCSEDLRNEFLTLPEITRASSRDWAKAMVHYDLAGREEKAALKRLLERLGINPLQRTAKRKRRKSGRVIKKYSDLDMGEVKQTWFEHDKRLLQERLNSTVPTQADQTEAIVDRIQKTMLKMLR
jgi:hypothetical protein